MTRVGIIGHGKDKFNPQTEAQAKALIRKLLTPLDTLISGRSPLGGIDIWAEEIANEIGAKTRIFEPKNPRWKPNGYKARNQDIAKTSDVVHVIVVTKYPSTYKKYRFDLCYHCGTDDHVKSGGCWTGHLAKRKGKPVRWHILGKGKEDYIIGR